MHLLMFINSCIALFINGVYLAFINTPNIEHVISPRLGSRSFGWDFDLKAGIMATRLGSGPPG